VSKNVVVVGGGLAGLAASLYLARGGRTVTLFEKRRFLGGRAITNFRHGYRFNLGAHAFYKGGAGAAVCRELGIPVRGAVPKGRSIALRDDRSYLLPATFISLLASRVVGFRGRRELAAAFWSIWRHAGAGQEELTVSRWLDLHFTDERGRDAMAALLRLATYSNRPERENAALALAQMRVAMRRTIYVDEGWQKIVDSMHSAAVSAGVNFVTSSRIVSLRHEDGAMRGVELGGLELDADRMDTQAMSIRLPAPDDVNGARLPAETVLLAVDPATAADLAGEPGERWAQAVPVEAACLDVALKTLPNPKNVFALGIDRPLYYSVHSRFAQLTPKGGALIHLVKYLDRETSGVANDEDARAKGARSGAGSSGGELELEGLLDQMQPGWRAHLVHRRFLPSIAVSNALVHAGERRPPVTTPVRGLYIAGDWVGDVGLLSDAALSSARAAAKAILAS
jgi:phytoene dehydrogenase-like protein